MVDTEKIEFPNIKGEFKTPEEGRRHMKKNGISGDKEDITRKKAINKRPKKKTKKPS